jgi:ribonuclease HI
MKHPLRPPSTARTLPFAADEPVSAARSDVFLAYVDGASRGNPGPASYAVILQAPDGTTKFEIGKYLGRATNNVAEYYALITALDYATSEKIARLRVRSDSQLLVRQMEGRYKVKSPELRPLHERAQKLARGLAYFAIEHVPREENREADALANVALDRTATLGGKVAAPPAGSPSSQATRTPAYDRAPKAVPSSSLNHASTGDGTRVGIQVGIRARYSAGALHPLQALDLDEGEIVDIQVGKLPGKKLNASDRVK